jgi:ABC-2 type transport system permease protein
MRLLLLQTRAELRVLLANGEQLLLTIGIPVMLMVFFGLVDVLPTGGVDRLDFVIPGVLALAVASTSMVGLGIATGFERSYLVLKRLGATPLGRGRLVGAKMAAVAAVQVVQACLLVPVAVAVGWRPDGFAPTTTIVAILLGTAAFAGIGLTLAGSLRAEINLAAQNALYLVLLLLGGMIFPADELPAPLEALSRGLPSTALADLVRDGLVGVSDAPGRSLMVLAAWAVIAPATAASTFRWS